MPRPRKGTTTRACTGSRLGSISHPCGLKLRVTHCVRAHLCLRELALMEDKVAQGREGDGYGDGHKAAHQGHDVS
eukprot:1145413-Pelagomonas_calceolata.AAC.2